MKSKKTKQIFTILLPKLIGDSMMMDPHIESSKPERMEDHMEHIVSLRRRINLEMSPRLNPSSLHSYILSRRYTH